MMNDYEYDEELAELMKNEKVDVGLTIMQEVLKEESLDKMTEQLLNGIKNGMLVRPLWDDIKSAVEELVKSFRADVTDYIYLFESILKQIENLREADEKLSKDDKNSNLVEQIAKMQYNLEVSELIIMDIIANNVAYILNNEKLVIETIDDKLGSTFVDASDSAYMKTRTIVFKSGAKDSVMFHKILHDMNRQKNIKGSSFSKLPDTTYNMAPHPDNWLVPIMGKKHHIFFDLLFESLAPDTIARNRLLDCIAWKYRHPEITNLPSPVHCGVGGSGKTGVGVVFKTIYGRSSVNWAAAINDDSMKNTGFLTAKIIVNFDDINVITLKSKEYQFLKTIVGNKTFFSRNLYDKAFEADMTAWIWVNGNPTNDEKCPVPLEGDGMRGVDRRWMPFIIKQDLIHVYMNYYPSLSISEAQTEVDYHFNYTLTNREEVAKWLGNIITNSGVDTKKITDYPKTYHGHDYEVLTNQVSKQVQQVYDFVFEQEKPEFISVGDLYDTYRLHCLSNNIEKKFIKRKDQFIVDIGKINNSIYEYKKWNRSRTTGSGQITGWRRGGYTKQTVDYTMSDWLENDALGDKKLRADYEILSYSPFQNVDADAKILKQKTDKMKVKK